MHRTKFFITGGGTGGHIYPAMAVVKELLAGGVLKEDIFYLGSKDNLEFDIVKKEGLNFLSYKVIGMPRKISPKFILFFWDLFFATVKAFFYALKYKPEVVFATGGYVCAPILIVAKILKIPYVLHDCDAHPGIVSRAFANNAYGVSLAFESAKKYLKTNNAKVLGNPIRKEFSTVTKDEARAALNIPQAFVILIMGGSLGAKKINEAAIDIVKKYANNENYHIIWQTGKKNFNDVKEKLDKEFNFEIKNLTLRPYFDEMFYALIASDVAISRAGSLSLSELCAAKLPSVLVPYPYAAQDHQRENAKRMCELGASKYLDDNDCTGESLLKALEEFIFDKEALNEAKKCAQKNAHLSAVSDIINLLYEAKDSAKRK